MSQKRRLDFRDQLMFNVELSSAAYKLYSVLDWHARDQGFTFAFDNTLQVEMGLGASRFYEIMAELRRHGAVERALDEKGRRGWLLGWHIKFRNAVITQPNEITGSRRGKFRKAGVQRVENLITETRSLNPSPLSPPTGGAPFSCDVCNGSGKVRAVRDGKRARPESCEVCAGTGQRVCDCGGTGQTRVHIVTRGIGSTYSAPCVCQSQQQERKAS